MRNKIDINKYKELNKQGTYIAKRYMRFYNDNFKSNAMDLEDLIQEANIIICKILDKYYDKDIKELKKIINTSIGFKFNDLRERGQNLKSGYNSYSKRIEKDLELDNDEIPEEILPSIEDEEEIKDRILNSISIEGESLCNFLLFSNEDEEERFRSELEDFLNKEKNLLKNKNVRFIYEVGMMKFYKGMINSEIARKLKISPERVRQLVEELKPKLRRYFEK